MSFSCRRGLVLSAALVSGLVTTGVARADDDDAAMFASPALKTYSSLAKIESNLGESAARLYLRAALPADSAERDKLADGYKTDVKVIEDSAAKVEKASLTGEAAENFAKFKKGWAEAKTLSESLMSASAGQPAKPEALTAHAEAYDDLDDAIDGALTAVAKDAKL